MLSEEGHAVSTCCDVFGVSASGFYDWKSRGETPRKRRQKELAGKIGEIFHESKKTYGSPRVKAALERTGEQVGEATVAKIMREEGMTAKKKKAFKPKTTINNPSDKKSPRVFKIEKTQVIRADQCWASDLTYIPTAEGFLYLVVVLDLFTRQVKGWSLSESMEACHTVAALIRAVAGMEGRPENLIYHSDQGSQYCDSDFRERLTSLGIIQSMSRKGNCYDNAYVESFFHSLKNELDEKIFSSKELARQEIFRYIETWYNTRRLHSSLGYLSPSEYAQQNCCAA